MKIEQSVILITGGASGLGENMAIYLAEKGADIFICDLAEDKGKKIEEESGGKIKFIKCDVTDEKNVEDMITNIKNKAGRLDALINSAGILYTEETANETKTHSLAAFEKVWRVNTYGAFNVSKHAAKLMIENASKNKELENPDNGCIIFVSSVSGIEGRMGKIAYSMSKAALIGMTLPMARDLGQWKIRVNTIAPLMIETPMIADWKNSDTGQKLMECIPLKKFGKPQNVSELIEFLIKNDFMNGETIRIDGGGRLGHFGG
jgi:3-hydroxyacyl-CoA dehydrogenase / 3-hydroxy-2-methylbutyryl-CoA dehydrogenase